MVNNLALSYFSKRVKERTLIGPLGAWWHLVLLTVLVTVPDDTGKWVKWTLLTLFLGYPYAHPILVSMQSSNAGSVRTRTVASSLYNMMVQTGSIVASNIYRTSDAPLYHTGNRILMGITLAAIVLFWFNKVYLVYRNNSRAKIWNSWTYEQKAEYLRTTTDKGNKRLDFRFLL